VSDLNILPESCLPRAQVTIKQDVSIGIPGAVYDCSLALAGYVVDEVLPDPPPPTLKITTATPAGLWQNNKPRAKRWRVLELGAGTGACGIIIAAAAAARGILIDALLTDRNDAALNLAALSAAAVATQVGCTIRTARYAFGDDAGRVLSLLSGGGGGDGGGGGGDSDSAPGCDVGRTDPPDLVVVSDVLYAPESAAPLVATLQQLLVRAGGWQGEVTRRKTVTDLVDALPVHPHEIFEGLGVHGFRPRASTVCSCPKF